MLEVPGWIFVILVVLSGLLLVLIGTCLVLLIFKQLRNKTRYKLIDDRELKAPYFSFTNFHDPVQYSYLPHTYPVTVQGQGYHTAPSIAGSESQRSSGGGDQDSGSVFLSPREKYRIESPKLHRRFGSIDELELTGNVQRTASKSITELRRPAGLMRHAHDFSEKSFSQTGSRKSSIGTEINDDKEYVASDKEVYLHSSLLNDMPHSDTSDLVFSYDQELGSPAKRFPSGALLFSFIYDVVVTELTINVKRAVDLPTLDEDQETVNSYVNFCIVPEDFYWQRTPVIEHNNDPIFDETFHIPDVLHHKLRQYSLCFLVMDSNKLHGERLIGKVMVPLSDLRAGVNNEMCKELVRG